jgi:hypothetical protein
MVIRVSSRLQVLGFTYEKILEFPCPDSPSFNRFEPGSAGTPSAYRPVAALPRATRHGSPPVCGTLAGSWASSGFAHAAPRSCATANSLNPVGERSHMSNGVLHSERRILTPKVRFSPLRRRRSLLSRFPWHCQLAAVCAYCACRPRQLCSQRMRLCASGRCCKWRGRTTIARKQPTNSQREGRSSVVRGVPRLFVRQPSMASRGMLPLRAGAQDTFERCMDGVPIENNGGDGTAASHWEKRIMNGRRRLLCSTMSTLHTTIRCVPPWGTCHADMNASRNALHSVCSSYVVVCRRIDGRGCAVDTDFRRFYDDLGAV